MRTKADIIAEVARSRRQIRGDWRRLVRAVKWSSPVARAWREARRESVSPIRALAKYVAVSSWRAALRNFS